MSITSASDVADYILWLSHEAGDLLTNLKLQKLIFYGQAWHLALNEEPLFDEDIQAWVHGPVVSSVYGRFKKFRWDRIGEFPDKEPELPEEVKDHLKEILNTYSSFSAWDLERITHNEDPWKIARGNIPKDDPSTAVLSKSVIKDYYKNLLKEHESI